MEEKINSTILLAAEKGDVNLVKDLLTGRNLGSKLKDEALMIVIREMAAKTMYMVNGEFQKFEGISSNKKIKYLNIIQTLLRNGANPNTMKYVGYEGAGSKESDWTFNGEKLYLYSTGKKGTIEKNVNSKGGLTALMLATIENQSDVVALLINHGADVGAKLEDGTTALKKAKEEKYAEIIKLLEKAGAKE